MEGKVATGAVLDGAAVDLAIPGSESTTRVVKMVSENTGDHFANEVEAQAVADNMKEESWVKKNCGVCGSSPPPLTNLISKRDRHDRRGNTMATCCRLPSTVEPNIDGDGDDPWVVRNLLDFGVVGERDLSRSPNIPATNMQLADEVTLLSSDLDRSEAGLVSWSPELAGKMSSDELLSTFRRIFTNPNSNMFKAMNVAERDGGSRLYTSSQSWITSGEPALQPLQAWVKAATEEVKDNILKLHKMPAGWRNQIETEIRFFYQKPSEALLDTGPRGLFAVNSDLQFAIADRPGLVIGNRMSKKVARVPSAKDSFYLLKGSKCNFGVFRASLFHGPTWQGAFGREMASEGRVGVTVDVNLPFVSICSAHFSRRNMTNMAESLRMTHRGYRLPRLTPFSETPGPRKSARIMRLTSRY